MSKYVSAPISKLYKVKHFELLWCYTKGQIISKWFLVSSISSKKRTKEFDFTTMTPQVDLFSFVFWRKSKTPKNLSEIIWPLIEQNMADSLKLILLYLYLFWVTLLQVPACNEVLDGVFNKDLFLGMPCCLMACSFCSIMVALCCFAISVVSTWKWMDEWVM